MATGEALALRRIGSGPPLLLVHGDFNTGAMAWRRQIERPHGRSLLVPDRRGYGDSPPLRGPHRIADDAADLLAVVDAAGIDAFDLAGHSYGGIVAVDLAVRAPDRVRSLVLVEPPWFSILPDDPAVRLLRERTGNLWNVAAGMSDEEVAIAFFSVLTDPSDLSRLRASRGWPGVVREARRAVLGQFPDTFAPSALERLRPDLGIAVLSGGRSHPGLRAIAREIARRRTAAMVVAPREGHPAQFDSAAFAAALAAAAPVGEPPAAPRPR